MKLSSTFSRRQVKALTHLLSVLKLSSESYKVQLGIIKYIAIPSLLEQFTNLNGRAVSRKLATIISKSMVGVE